MKTLPALKKSIAGVIAAALVLLSPGLPCYQALAAEIENGGPRGGAPAAIPVAAVPAVADLGAPALPGSPAMVSLAVGTQQLPAGPAFPPAPAALGAAPIGASPDGPLGPGSLITIESLAAVQKPVAAAQKPAAPRQASEAAVAAANLLGPAGGELVRQLSDPAVEKHGVLGWLFDRLGSRKAASAAAAQAVAGKASAGAAHLAPAGRKAAPAGGSGAGRSSVEGEAAVKGKALLLVGTISSRPFILEDTRRTADKLGLELYLIDTAENRKYSAGIVADDHFIAAPIDLHDDATMASVADKVAEFSKEHKIDAVLPVVNMYVEVAGKIVDKTGAAGDSGETTRTAHVKDLARQVLSRTAELATTYRTDIKSADEARKAFREMGGDPIVLKPRRGAGSSFVKVGIKSEDEAAAAWTEINEGIKNFAKNPDSKFDTLDVHPGVMMERMLTGPEVDVELVVQTARDGKLEAVFAHVSDNPPMEAPYAVEKGATFPSQLSEEHKKELVRAALLAVEKLGFKSGNAHVELMLTPEGPKVLEVNKRMGGAFVYEAVKELTGVSLIEQSIRSLFGIAVPQAEKVDGVVESRLIIPQVTGTIVGIEGLAELEKDPAVKVVRMLKKDGDRIQAAPDNFFDYYGWIVVKGASGKDAYDKAMAALSKLNFKVRTADGRIVDQRADYSHEYYEPEKHYQEVVKPAIEKREKILKGYLKGQLALIASFALYYSLFSPFTRAIGGEGALASGRSGYAGALAIFSPISGVLAQRFSARRVLIGAFVARAVIWGLLVPTAFFALGTGAAFAATLFALMLADGAIVSINTLVDIDNGGIDILGAQHHFPVDDATRNRYNAILDGFYSAARVLIAPAMAGLAVVLTVTGVLQSAAIALAVVMGLSFAIPATIGVTQYLKHIPTNADLGNREADASAGQKMGKIWSDLKSGLKVAWSNKKIRWRYLLNSLERSRDDAFLFVVLASFGMNVMFPAHSASDKAWGAFATAALIGVGKIGSIITAKALHGAEEDPSKPKSVFSRALAAFARAITPKELHGWKAPQPGEGKYPKYKPFFGLDLKATLAAGLIALAAVVAMNISFWPGVAIAALGSFLFNLYFTAAKLGFRNLMQGIIKEEGQGAVGQLYSIQNVFEMGMTAVVTSLLSALFVMVPVAPALMVTAAFYLLSGLVSKFVAPRLVFTPEERGKK